MFLLALNCFASVLDSFFLMWNAVLANHNSIFDLAFVIWAATGTLQSVANVLDQVLVTLHS